MCNRCQKRQRANAEVTLIAQKVQSSALVDIINVMSPTHTESNIPLSASKLATSGYKLHQLRRKVYHESKTKLNLN